MRLAPGLFLLTCICISEVLSVSHVPVLLWSSERSLWDSAPTINEGHILSHDDLHRILQVDGSRTRSIVVFLQDTLSMDDITYYSTAYGSDSPLHNVKDVMDSSPASLVLPAVDWKAIRDLSGYLRNQADWNLMEVDNFMMSSIDLDSTKPNLIIIRLQSIPRSNPKLAASAFSENDKQIAKITNELRHKGLDFIAMYTGLKPSKVAVSYKPDTEQKRGRELLSTDTIYVPYPPLNVTNGTDTCILIYATTFVIRVNGSIELDLTNMTFQAHSAITNFSECSDENTTLSLIYSPPPAPGLKSLEVRFFMTNMFYSGSARNWFKLETVMIIPNDDMSRNATFRTSYASSPAEYSYHCQILGTSALYGENLVPANKEANNWEIKMNEFQIQGFNVKNNLFSYASDCSGFFSQAIWMALVSCIILLWILSYGIYMLMQLTTNDKFDDPKGQPLSVPQGE